MRRDTVALRAVPIAGRGAVKRLVGLACVVALLAGSEALLDDSAAAQILQPDLGSPSPLIELYGFRSSEDKWPVEEHALSSLSGLHLASSLRPTSLTPGADVKQLAPSFLQTAPGEALHPFMCPLLPTVRGGSAR
ncbi:hypothetical protein BESB_080260 [Besnoitia besnoiti]|uniref:Uncharacterized protein n=1 Tax=Besnoitia besnoiti TaxID=94643 RepID=A0A2A9MEK4_BESBE|nr:hypothetical protein BESB_080260 [Besnoitia besnoiti]PFH33810.1 hypothetical protein BESB_080260 [Besnoitia besnoiti]